MLESFSSSKLYGNGVFTTIAIVDGAPFLWEKHWQRLTANAAKLEIDIREYSEAEVFEKLMLEVENNGLKEGRVRITFADESDSEIWSQTNERRTNLSIITAGRRTLPTEFSLSISPHRINTTSPVTGIKSCNYLEHLLAYKDARSRGFEEAIRLDENGEIASACMANIFWLTDGKLYTPSLKTGCLAGTTREYILENLDCEEVEAGIDVIKSADAVYLTSAGIGVRSIIDFDGTGIKTVRHEIEKLLPY